MRDNGLRQKLVGSMVITIGFVTVASLAVVMVMQYLSATYALEDIQSRIQASLSQKGSNLVHSQSLTLRGLAADNAFGDIRSIVLDTVRRDDDIVYGLFLSEGGEPWAYVSPTTDAGASVSEAFDELKIDPSRAPTESTQVSRRLFDQELLEFSSPVYDEDFFLGTIRYGISQAPMKRAVARARAESFHNALVLVALMLMVTLGCMAAAIVRSRWEAAGRLSVR